MKASVFHEMDLYPPLEKFLKQHGYLVHAEVIFSDISATREGFLLIVEIKLKVNLDVILQAIERQRAADAVYIAIPLYNFNRYPKRWRGIRTLCNRLGIGVFFVRFIDGREPEVEVGLARRAARSRNRGKKENFLTEMEKRGVNRNLGGSVRRPIFTAYRMESLRILGILKERGPLSPKMLRTLGCGSNTGRILIHNYYGWFCRMKRGIYHLTDLGENALHEYSHMGK